MWISVGIAVLMATSIVGFLTFGNPSSPYGSFEYNNITILGSQDGWAVPVGDAEKTFKYLPSDVERIPYPSDMPNWIRQVQVITMTSSPDDNLSEAIGAVEYSLFTQFGEEGKIIMYAFVENNTFNKPIMTCANATLYQPIILFQSGDETEITRKEYCIIATANTDYNMLRLGERLLYTHYQIIADDVVVNDVSVPLSMSTTTEPRAANSPTLPESPISPTS